MTMTTLTLVSTQNLHLDLAREFSRIIREWLRPDQVETVNKRNATPLYRGCCATHDFCDANQAMIDAFVAVTGREPTFDCDDNPSLQAADHDLISAAWDLAKAQGFANR